MLQGQFRLEQEKEFMLRNELRRLKQEDIRQLRDRVRRLELKRKVEIIAKEQANSDYLRLVRNSEDLIKQKKM